MQENELVILHEDNHILVVLKPQNEPCCPDATGDVNTLDRVKDYIKTAYCKAGNAYAGLIHRLDRPTGGVMVFAKTSKAAARLSEQLKNKGFSKRYFAVLCGVPSKKKGLLENYLRKNSVNNCVYVCTPAEEGAKLASLEYEITDSRDGLALADINLLTGRTHQIRVQFSALNCPVYGDMRYGGEKAVKGKLALWAYSLSFTHPVTGDKLRFMAEPPEGSPWDKFGIKLK